MKLYTKTGDQGQTSLIGGRTDKDSLRVESYGTIDELNSFIGLALAELADCENCGDVKAELRNIQHELFDCGGDLATVTEHRSYTLRETSISALEDCIDRYTAEAPRWRNLFFRAGIRRLLSFISRGPSQDGLSVSS